MEFHTLDTDEKSTKVPLDSVGDKIVDSNSPIIEQSSSTKSSKERKNKKPGRANKKSKALLWVIKITIITLILSAVFSLVSEFTNYLHYGLSILLLFFLIVISLISDAVGVATTSCNPEPIYALASRKIPGSKQALILIRNADKVSNICCDVIGDICGIVSGALLIAITFKLSIDFSESARLILNIVASSIVAAMIVGGKAFLKGLAVNKSKEIVLATAKLVALFYNPKESSSKKKKK